jgi:hypothetical protein
VTGVHPSRWTDANRGPWCGRRVDRTAACPGVVLCNVRCHVDLTHLRDEVGRVIEHVPQIRQARFGVIRLPVQPGVGIGRRRMRVVLPVLPSEVAPIAALLIGH